MADSKKVAESRTVMTELVMPNDTNPLGDLMGGNLMRWMDIAGGICAAKHCGAHVVTASVDHVSFKRPIKMGDVVTINACVTKAFNTSLEIYIQVRTGRVIESETVVANSAFMTFVAMDRATHTPIPIPKVEPITEKEKRLFEGAQRRRELRLIFAGRLEAREAVEIKSLFVEGENGN